MEILLRNLPIGVNDMWIRHLFTPFGRVLFAKAFNEVEESLWFVTMKSKRKAKEAIKSLHKATIEGRIIKVRKIPKRYWLLRFTE